VAEDDVVAQIETDKVRGRVPFTGHRALRCVAPAVLPRAWPCPLAQQHPSPAWDTHAHTHTRTHTCPRTHTHTRTRTRTHTHTHTHTHAHTHTHTHTHATTRRNTAMPGHD
jgi:hypothetical protein